RFAQVVGSLTPTSLLRLLKLYARGFRSSQRFARRFALCKDANGAASSRRPHRFPFKSDVGLSPRRPIPYDPAAMATETLSEFIQLLDREGELARVKARVSPVLEVAEIADRMSKSPAPHGHNELDRSPAAGLGGEALLFENVEGSDIPVARN